MQQTVLRLLLFTFYLYLKKSKTGLVRTTTNLVLMWWAGNTRTFESLFSQIDGLEPDLLLFHNLNLSDCFPLYLRAVTPNLFWSEDALVHKKSFRWNTKKLRPLWSCGLMYGMITLNCYVACIRSHVQIPLKVSYTPVQGAASLMI